MVLVSDPEGFEVLVPEGWSRRTENNSTYYDSPEGNAYLQVDTTPHPTDDEYQHVQGQDQEDSASGRLPGYQLERLDDVVSNGRVGEFLRIEDIGGSGPEDPFDRAGGYDPFDLLCDHKPLVRRCLAFRMSPELVCHVLEGVAHEGQRTVRGMQSGQCQHDGKCRQHERDAGEDASDVLEGHDAEQPRGVSL